MADHAETVLGTRILMLEDDRPGSGIQVTNDEEGITYLDVRQGHRNGVLRVQVRMTQREVLSLISSLSVAATPNTGKPIITLDMSDPEDRKEAFAALASNSAPRNHEPAE